MGSISAVIQCITFHFLVQTYGCRMPLVLGRLWCLGLCRRLWWRLSTLPTGWLSSMSYNILIRPVILICTTPVISVSLRHVDSLGLWEVFPFCTSVVTIVSGVLDLIVRIPLNLLVEVGNALCSIENWFADSALGIGVDRYLELVAASIAHRVHSLMIASDWSLWDGLVQIVRVRVLRQPWILLSWVIDFQSCPLMRNILTIRRWWLIFLLLLLRLASRKVLL